MNFKIFAFNLLEPINCILSILYSKISFKTKFKKFKKLIKNKNLYIIGTGSSLDNFNFSKIQKSVVILVNGAYEISKKIPKNNILIWHSADVGRVDKILNKIDSQIKCIITLGKYWGIYNIFRSNNEILYYHAKSSIKFKKLKIFYNWNLWVPVYSPLVSRSNFIDIKKNYLTIPGPTSVLSALIILKNFEIKSLNLVGTDMSKKNASINFYKKNKNNITKQDILRFKQIMKIVFEDLKKRKIKIKNYSSFNFR